MNFIDLTALGVRHSTAVFIVLLLVSCSTTAPEPIAEPSVRAILDGNPFSMESAYITFSSLQRSIDVTLWNGDAPEWNGNQDHCDGYIFITFRLSDAGVYETGQCSIEKPTTRFTPFTGKGFAYYSEPISCTWWDAAVDGLVRITSFDSTHVEGEFQLKFVRLTPPDSVVREFSSGHFRARR